MVWEKYKLTEENRQSKISCYLRDEKEILKYLRFGKFSHAWNYGIREGITVFSVSHIVVFLPLMIIDVLFLGGKAIAFGVWLILSAVCLVGWFILVFLHEYGICQQKRECLAEVRRAIQCYRYEYD